MLHIFTNSIFSGNTSDSDCVNLWLYKQCGYTRITMNLITTFKVVFVLLMTNVSLASGQALPNECATDVQIPLLAKSGAGDKQAQFMLGSQLLTGLCSASGQKDVAKGFKYINQSAAQNYPPAMYLVGVSHLRRGLEQPGLAMLFGAAKGGFREAEIMLGTLFANEKFAKKSTLNAYGWLALARHHSSNEKQQKLLDVKLAEVKARMNATELSKAEETKTKFIEEMGNIPAFSEAR